ncbi:MAG TPA: response regulator [Ohtaekwangia sp.]
MMVLYAEDDNDDFDFFSETLKSVDASIRIVNTKDGQETLDFLENDLVLPDMIFLDINMPLMDGKSCLKEIKNRAHLRHIPVVIYTTSNNPQDREHCMQLGALDYVEKPTSMQGALSTLTSLVKGNNFRFQM